jgi:hypothetical protein
MGYSGVIFNPNAVSVAFRSAAGRVEVCRSGRGLPFDEALAKKILTEHDIVIDITIAAAVPASAPAGAATSPTTTSKLTAIIGPEHVCVSAHVFLVTKELLFMNNLERAKILVEALPYIQKFHGKVVVVNTAATP